MQWKIYLSGEIHTDWREQIIEGTQQQQLPVSFSTPVTNHGASDAAGDVLGKPQDDYWRDHQSASINAIRTQTHIRHCDIAVIRFGSEYKQWNAAFDAGYCAALGKPYITLHDAAIVHPLKEVDASAQGWAKTPQQVVEILNYLILQQ
jgi:YtoQ family protein